MSKQQPMRPGARRPAAGPPSKAGAVTRSGQTIEDLRRLSDTVDTGEDTNLDPAEASSGLLNDETVTIVGASFRRFEYITKDGVKMDIAPETDLFLNLRRDSQEPEDKPWEERYKYGSFGIFAPTPDGNKVKPRPEVVKERGKSPRPSKFSPAVLLLQSFKDAGLSMDTVNSGGAKALVGLRVHVRRRSVTGQHENAKPVLLVDHIEEAVAQPASSQPAPGGTTSGNAATSKAADKPAKSAKSAEPKAASGNGTPAASDVYAVAEQCLTDLLSEADGNTLVRSGIAKAFINSATWATHGQRGDILKLFRDDAFMMRDGTPWVVSGSDIIQA